MNCATSSIVRSGRSPSQPTDARLTAAVEEVRSGLGLSGADADRLVELLTKLREHAGDF